MTWHAIRTTRAHEEMIVEAVAAFGPPFRGYCPMQWVRWKDARGLRHERRAPLWPGYALADWPAGDAAAWHRVMDLAGVLGVIGGAEPVVIPDGEIAAWVERTGADGVVRGLEELIRRFRYGYERGDGVIVDHGAFVAVAGTCLWVGDEGTCVEIAWMGTVARVVVPPGAVRPGAGGDLRVPAARQIGVHRKKGFTAAFRIAI